MNTLHGTVENWEVISIVVCILLSAFYSASETAITSLGVLKTKQLLEAGNKNNKELNFWLKSPGKVLTTILIVNNVVNIFASVLATEIAVKIFANNAIGIVVGLLTFVILLFGEIVPKSLAKVFHLKWGPFFLKVVYLSYLIMMPIVVTLSYLTQFIIRSLVGEAVEQPPITKEELNFLLEVGQKPQVIGDVKKDMMQGVFSFDATTVKEVMTPRTDVEFINDNNSVEEVLKIAVDSGFSRFPVHTEQGADHITGVLLVKDFLKVAIDPKNSDMSDTSLKDLIRPICFIPESIKIIDAFKKLKKSKMQLAIVADEHGGTAGIITMEDILEEIVGEIQDEYDTEEEDIVQISENVFEVAGALPTEHFIEKFEIEASKVDVDKENFETIAGWVTFIVGELPEIGAKVVISNYDVEVTAKDGTRINKLKVTKHAVKETIVSEDENADLRVIAD